MLKIVGILALVGLLQVNRQTRLQVLSDIISADYTVKKLLGIYVSCMAVVLLLPMLPSLSVSQR